jgi:hypothetical protein
MLRANHRWLSRAYQSELMAARAMPLNPDRITSPDKGRNPSQPDSRAVRALCFRRLLTEIGQNDGCRRLSGRLDPSLRPDAALGQQRFGFLL